MTPTQSKMYRIATAVLQTLQETRSTIPSGNLYAMLLGQVTLEEFEEMLRVLSLGGLVHVKNHLIHGTEKLFQHPLASRVA